MIKLYYSGAASWKSSQTLSSKSIGGYISNTTVPNGLANSLFQDLGELDLWKDKSIVNYIGVAAYVFYFEGEEAEKADYKNFTFEIDYNEEFEQYKDLFEFSVGIAPIAGDEVKGLYIEQIRSIESKPYYLTYDFEVLEKGNIVRFSKLSTNGIGIWFCRKFNPIKAKELFGCQSDYWLDHEALPSFNFNFDIKIGLENYDGDYFKSNIGVDRIKPNSDVSLEGYTIQVFCDDVLTDSGVTSLDEIRFDLDARVNATKYEVVISKELSDGLFEGRFIVTKEQLENGLTYWVDEDGKVFYKYVKTEVKELFLGNDNVAVDWNYIWSNSFWVCFVNDTETREYKENP